MTAGSPQGDSKLHRASLAALLLTGCLATTMTVTATNSPKIIQPTNDTISTTQGDPCTIPCMAKTKWPQFCLVYWMVNNSFLEDTYPEGRAKEEKQSYTKQGDLYTVERPLVITSTQAEDFTRTFTCVIQDPSGFDVKNITLVASAKEPTINNRKRGKRGRDKNIRRNANRKDHHHERRLTSTDQPSPGQDSERRL